MIKVKKNKIAMPLIMVPLHTEGKCLSADIPMDSTWILANKTWLVASFYNGYIYP